MTRFLSLASLGAFGLLAIGQRAASEVPIKLKPFCGGPFQLCGFVEPDSKEPRIPQRYEVALPFNEGLAGVRLDGLFGFIDTRGEIVVAPRYRAVSSFSGGYAQVRIGNASGVIDRSGRLVIPANFRRIIHFSGDGFLAEPLPKGEAERPAQDERLDILSHSIAWAGPQAAGLYHRDRGWLTDQDLSFSIFDDPQRGLIWAGKRNEQSDDQWGLLKSDGSWQVSPRYHHVQRLSETHAVVEAMPDYSLPPQQRREALRRGAVDRDGKLVVPMQFAQLSYWRGGYGYAIENKPYGSDGSRNDVREGIVKVDGSLLANRYFDKVDISESGLLPRGRIGSIWYSITPRGQMIPDQLDGQALVECDGGMTILHRGEQAEFRRPGDGRVVGRFDNAYFGKRDCPGPFSARRGDRWFFVLEDGNVLGGGRGFEETYAMSGGHGAVRMNGEWGIIDRSGNFTVRPRFAKLRPDRNNTFAVGEGSDTYWIDPAEIGLIAL